MRWRSTLASSALFIASACGSALTVRGDVVLPAQIPVRAFPRIVVTAQDTPESLRVAQRLVEHLARGESVVRSASESAIERLRRDGRIRRATAIVRVFVVLNEREQPGWGRIDGTDCGPLGCVEASRSSIVVIPVLTGQMTLTVIDGPSGRALLREQVDEEESGQDVLAMRMRVVERLVTRALELVDQRTERVAVQLHPIDHAAVRDALAAIRQGRWTRGRGMLERFVGSTSFEALRSEERALVLYDLGQICRFDRSLPADERFRRSAGALRRAVRLDPEIRYANALAELEAHRQSRALVHEQDDAMAHNFRIAEDPTGASVPDPPATYR